MSNKLSRKLAFETNNTRISDQERWANNLVFGHGNMRDYGRGYARKRSLAGFISQSNLDVFFIEMFVLVCLVK